MKIKTLVLVIMAFCIVSFLYAIPPCGPFCGTYVNSDYDNQGIMAKFILDWVCYYKIYEKTTSTKPIWEGENLLSDTFLSDDGMLIRICVQNEDGSSYYGLLRFSYDYWDVPKDIEVFQPNRRDLAKVLEVIWSDVDYLNEINPNDSNYRIYYRIK
jgi:hypothetical protein